MTQSTNIKLMQNKRNDDNIKFDEQDLDIDFNQLLKGMEPSNDDFKKRWEEALTGEEFWGEIENTIHTHFKTKNEAS